MCKVGLADFMNGDDVRMIQSGSFGLLYETPHALLIVQNFSGQDFQGHITVQLCIARQIDFTHPACAELGADFVATKMCTRGDCYVGPTACVLWCGMTLSEYDFPLKLPLKTHSESHAKGQVEKLRLEEVRI